MGTERNYSSNDCYHVEQIRRWSGEDAMVEGTGGLVSFRGKTVVSGIQLWCRSPKLEDSSPQLLRPVSI